VEEEKTATVETEGEEIVTADRGVDWVVRRGEMVTERAAREGTPSSRETPAAGQRTLSSTMTRSTVVAEWGGYVTSIGDGSSGGGGGDRRVRRAITTPKAGRVAPETVRSDGGE